MSKLFHLIVIGLIGIYSFKISKWISYELTPMDSPKIDTNKYWGENASASRKDEGVPQQQQIYYDEDLLKELNTRLNTTFHKIEQIDVGDNQDLPYGVTSEKLELLIRYWRESFLVRWKQQNMELELLPQFTMKIHGLTIHYHHTKNDFKKGLPTIPILILHDWPEVSREYYNLVMNLTRRAREDNKFLFEIVVPSLPGFTFSETPSKPGMSSTEIAILMRKLMHHLGYNQYVVQGNGIGSLVGSAIATLYPSEVIGFHSTPCYAPKTSLSLAKYFIASVFPERFITESQYDFHFPLTNKILQLMKETGGYHIHATKPDTVGIALSNNPIGLAAYLLQFNPLGKDLESSWEEIKPMEGNEKIKYSTKYNAFLDTVMLFYVTNSLGTSLRFFAEESVYALNGPGLERVPVTVPTACARFSSQQFNALDWQLTDKYLNLIQSTYHNITGNHIPLTATTELIEDIITFVKLIQK